MKVLVDTSIWSLAFRRKKPNYSDIPFIKTLEILIQDHRAVMCGVIRQELLSGITHDDFFEKLKSTLRAFDDFNITKKDHELAAHFFNRCRKQGIQGSHIDFLICALAVKRNIPIFTQDIDFMNYQKIIEIKLYKIQEDRFLVHESH
ncbi:MAG: PIN domain-containing protein [Candidatus Marinimicrobia bacterium]|nr:PIN domain-containing protein [Candidatus Neomarinimicrobiota bacterium]